jgi:hypothetical protein
LAEACIFAYQARDASAYLALFSREADYVGFAGQDYARISELRDELAGRFSARGILVYVSRTLGVRQWPIRSPAGMDSDSGRPGEPVAVASASFLRVDGTGSQGKLSTATEACSSAR